MRASPTYPTVMGFGGGTLSGGDRLYLKPPEEISLAAHTLPVVEALKPPGCDPGSSRRLLIDPIPADCYPGLEMPLRPAGFPRQALVPRALRVFPATRCVAPIGPNPPMRARGLAVRSTCCYHPQPHDWDQSGAHGCAPGQSLW